MVCRVCTRQVQGQQLFLREKTMKNLWLSIALFFSASMVNGQQVSRTTLNNLAKLSWLTGTWTRTNNEMDRTGMERWQKSSSMELRGIGVSIKGKDTLFVEKLRILVRQNDLFYVADVPENQMPVYFKLTEVTDTGFICENPEHNFPKRISYQLDGDKLKATISGDGKAVDYLFVKQ
jgi:Domain of unknown function (DUF6265)